MKPNRFSGFADPKPRTPKYVPLGGYLGYFLSGFIVLGVPLVVFRQVKSLIICGCASWFWGSLPCFFVKYSRGSFKSVEPNRLSGPDVHFWHFGGLGPYITRMSVRRRSFSMLGAGSRHCQNDAQDAQFEHFVGLAPDIARIVKHLWLEL